MCSATNGRRNSRCDSRNVATGCSAYAPATCKSYKHGPTHNCGVRIQNTAAAEAYSPAKETKTKISSTQQTTANYNNERNDIILTRI
jgi:hypothetical protein